MYPTRPGIQTRWSTTLFRFAPSAASGRDFRRGECEEVFLLLNLLLDIRNCLGGGIDELLRLAESSGITMDQAQNSMARCDRNCQVKTRNLADAGAFQHSLQVTGGLHSEVKRRRPG